jgi:hypothetical protein
MRGELPRRAAGLPRMLCRSRLVELHRLPVACFGLAGGAPGGPPDSPLSGVRLPRRFGGKRHRLSSRESQRGGDCDHETSHSGEAGLASNFVRARRRPRDPVRLLRLRKLLPRRLPLRLLHWPLRSEHRPVLSTRRCAEGDGGGAPSPLSTLHPSKWSMVMRLPVQARPVARSTSSAGLRLSVTQSGFCEIACNLLPEPLRSICKAAC